ncbi:MAG: carboxypeptidase-like regulatory domain-containing protein [Firmicutes bacterium]|nr:carboxypeptidase-like regulatory domain-containing protein [Bacillota bacterium]
MIKQKSIKKRLFLILLTLPFVALILSLFACKTNSTQSLQSPFEDVENIYNVVVFANFLDAKFTSGDYSNIEEMLNSTSKNSARRYFYELSGEKLDISSVFVFYDSDMTSEKFKSLNLSGQINFVKQALNDQEIYSSVTKDEVFGGNLDANNDNLVDAITVFIPMAISNLDSGTAAWPHTVLSESPFSDTFKGLKYNRFIINPYKYQSVNSSGAVTRTLNYPIGVMCHEMLHNLGNDVGIQDLYRYYHSDDPEYSKIHPVGFYDVMAVTDYEKPQDLNAYYKYKLGWGTLTTQNAGEITFSKSESTAVKFGEKDGEFFVAQYYKKTRINGQDVNEGVLIYRVNSNVKTGNMYKSNGDEILVFSKDGFNNYVNFDAIFENGSYFKNFEYSDGEYAKINLKINFNEDEVTLNIESYCLEFVNEDGTPIVGEIDISYMLDSNTVAEKTKAGSFIFSSEFISKNIKISFYATGYKFYLDKILILDPENNGIQYIDNLDEIIPNETESYTIKIYVKAVERNITFVFTNAFKVPLMDPVVFGTVNGIPIDIVLSGSSTNLNVKNGDKIAFTINGILVAEIIVSPQIAFTADIRLVQVFSISGTILNNDGLPIAGAEIRVNGSLKTKTGEDGKFTLKNLEEGDTITIKAEDYLFNSHIVNGNNQNLIFKATLDSFNFSVIIVIFAGIAVAGITILTVVKTVKRQRSYFNHDTYFE